jgi:hypothetical protein
MAYAALQLVARRYNRATMWDQLEASLAKPAAPQRQARPAPPQSSFLTNW